MIDYLGYILFKAIGFCIKILPRNFSVFLGKRLGDLFYGFDFKHRAIAYSNIKIAFGEKLSPAKIKNITRNFYQTFGQNLIEIFLIPTFNKEYLDKYIHIEGYNHILEGFKRGKGVIILGVHEGSWELSSVICANLGFTFNMLTREQALPRLNRLLNSYRLQKGCKLINRSNQMRYLLEALKRNEAVGMTLDQGGREGIPIKFFGKNASMSTGAVRIALKYGAAIVPVFFFRAKDAHIKIFVDAPFDIQKSGDFKKDIRDNLQRLVSGFESYISMYPQEYLWTYKVYKYSNERKILILSDGRAGHLRQSQAIAGIASRHLNQKAIMTTIETKEVKFKNSLFKLFFSFNSCFSGKYNCQGCLWCIRLSLEEESFKSLISSKPDIIISCGSLLSPINFLLARENLAKSIVIMRPSVLSTRRFDLVIMPRHDNPPKDKNVVKTQGAPNLIDEDYLNRQSEKLLQSRYLKSGLGDNCIGLLIGGDTKNFFLDTDVVRQIIYQLKELSRKFNIDILVTTSRRTSGQIENLIKQEFKDFPACKLIIIANEFNIPEAVGGILGLSKIIITSPESISMISEAINSKRYVLVFESAGLSKKHLRFLDNCANEKFIYLIDSPNLSKKIEDILTHKPLVNSTRDNILIAEAIEKIL